MALGDGVLYGLGAALCFALEPLLYERGARGLPPLLANLVRLPLPLAVLALYVLASPFAGEALATEPVTVAVIIAGGVVNLAVADTLFIGGIHELGASRAVTLSAVYPLFVMVLLREPVTLAVLAGVLLVAGGIALASGPRDDEAPPPGPPHPLHGIGPGIRPPAGSDRVPPSVRHVRGVSLCLGAALCWAVGIAVFKLAVGSVRPELLNLYRLSGSLLFLLAANALAGGLRGDASPVGARGAAALSLGGLVGMVLGSVLLYRALALAPGGVVSAVTAASPIITALLALLRGDRVSGRLLAGVLATVAGIVLVVS